jgi:hypothetical protein
MTHDTYSTQLGFFGNIWVRQNVILKSGTISKGHKHHFDHVSLLTNGKVRVSVEGSTPKEFTAPTFIVIKKEYMHTFEALTDNVIWYCVFALRDVDGEVTDFYSGDNSPYDRADSPDYDRIKIVVESTSQEN